MAIEDISKLTLKEIAKFEELAGISWAQFWSGDDRHQTGKALAACAFIVKRRRNAIEGLPPFSWNDAMGLTSAEANEIIFGEEYLAALGAAPEPEDDEDVDEEVHADPLGMADFS